MRLWGSLAVTVALLSCYRAPQSDESCRITCSGAPDSCPGDLSCEGGFCVAPGQVCKPSFATVTAGTGFACAIDTSGHLWCWGANLHHQISPGDPLRYPLATRVEATRSWQKIDAGGEHVCAISEGRLFCWGNNDRGQVSDTVSGDVAMPLEISIVDGPAAWTAVAAGARSTCAIGDRKVWCWGANERGQLGDGTQSDRGTPAPVQTTLEDWVAVAIGDTHACAISETSGVHCWGASNQGQTGTFVGEQLVPRALNHMATSIAVSGLASCATNAAGELHCGGNNSTNELGMANFGAGASGVPLLADTAKGWSSVDAAKTTFCGVRDGQVVCWGTTTNGGLGNGFWRQSAADRAFGDVTGTAGTTRVSLGWNERIDELTMTDAGDLTLACALVGSDVVCWGDNRFGQLAMGAATMELAPTPIDGDPTLTDLEAGLSHACGIEDGVVLCWGSTDVGAATGVLAGNPARACNPNLDCDVASPKPLNFFSTSATDMALGALHTCALHEGVITCWGDSSAMQLVSGNPPPPRERDIPGPGGATWTGLYQTGRLGQCAVYRSGMTDATACWGNVLAQRTAPTPLAVLNDATAFALGSTPGGLNFDCILDATGMLQCQGDNSYGQYGDGTTNGVATLAPVTPARTYTAIATNTGSPTVCAIRSDTGVECWGNNDRGQTGSTVFSPTLSPNQLPELAQCTAVAVGRHHACSICDGSIACWGDNRFGQLGTGALDGDPQPMPRVVAGPPSDGAWVQLVAGMHFTCARSDRGAGVCWGFDLHAALGNGGRSANLPVVVRASPAQ